jgi:hypothetical protein
MSERIFAVVVPYNINSVLQLLGIMYPDRKFGGPVDDHGVDLTVYRETGRAKELLRRMGKAEWTELETSVAASCQTFF